MSRELLVTVDEIGPNRAGELLATLVTDDGKSFTLPAELLPADAGVNDVLRLNIATEPDETRARHQRIRNLQHRLFGNL